MEWDAVKEHAQKWYGKTAHFLMFQGCLLYTSRCV